MKLSKRENREQGAIEGNNIHLRIKSYLHMCLNHKISDRGKQAIKERANSRIGREKEKE